MLQDTGERIIPDEMKPNNLLLLEHLARYSFALPYVKGRVLDIACGSGYGAHMLAKLRKRSIQELVAVDIHQDALDYARKRYYHPLITYQKADVLDPLLSERLGTFDVIISFETIEHVENDRLFKQMKSLLRRGGKLILSTPFGRGRGIPSGEPFHFHQLNREEFQSSFGSFRKVDFYYQNGVAIEKGIILNESIQPPRQEAKYALGIAVASN